MSRNVNIEARPNPSHQPSGVFRVRTIELILSVTVPNVCPGAITGGVAGTLWMASGPSDGGASGFRGSMCITTRNWRQDTETNQPQRHRDTETNRRPSAQPVNADRFGGPPALPAGMRVRLRSRASRSDA